MGKIKSVYIELKRQYPNWDEADMSYLFKQYVKNIDKPQKSYKNNNKKSCKSKN
jgi:hypothetical protein